MVKFKNINKMFLLFLFIGFTMACSNLDVKNCIYNCSCHLCSYKQNMTQWSCLDINQSCPDNNYDLLCKKYSVVQIIFICLLSSFIIVYILSLLITALYLCYWKNKNQIVEYSEL